MKERVRGISVRKARVLAVTLSVVMVVCALGFTATAYAAPSGPVVNYGTNYNAATGKNVPGWVKWVDANGDVQWRYYNNNVQVLGWLKSTNGEWYYLSQSQGLLQGQGLYDVNTEAFYWFDNGGAMVTGWHKIYWNGGNESAWFYFLDDGRAISDGWHKIGGYWYYFYHSADIYEYTGSYMMPGMMNYGYDVIDGEAYYFGQPNDGAMKTGWQYVAGSCGLQPAPGAVVQELSDVSGRRRNAK